MDNDSTYVGLQLNYTFCQKAFEAMSLMSEKVT